MEITTIHQSIKKAFEALSPQLSTHYGMSDFLFEQFSLITKDTYDAIYLLLEKEVTYSLQAEFLTRTLIETLFNILFIAEDDQLRSEWYGKVGYKKLVEERKRFENRWDDGSQWAQQQITSYKDAETLLVNDFKISAAEISNPESIQTWPTPSVMLKQMRGEDKRYLKYVHTCFYGSSSELIHGGFKTLFYSLTKSADVINKPRVLTDFYSKAATFFLSIISEIASRKNIDMNELLKKAWGNLYQNVGPHIDELIEFRYSQFVDKT
jgi:hypothetical protein